jgi:hypothetical protein
MANELYLAVNLSIRWFDKQKFVMPIIISKINIANHAYEYDVVFSIMLL